MKANGEYDLEIGVKMERKIKVLHVLKSSIYSGAENVVLTIIKHLRNDYELAYVATDGEIRSVLEEEEINFFLLDKFSGESIRKVIKKFEPDIVHAHDFTATVICTSIHGRFRIISHLHYDPPWSRKWNFKTLIYILSASRISKILSVSKKSYQNMIFADMMEEKCEVIGNPIDIDRISKMGDLEEQVETIDLLFVGRFVEQKNPQRFIQIVKVLAQKGVNLKCAMLGDGELWEDCRRLIAEYELQEQIQLLGFKKNPYIYMKAAKILCVTSRWEGFGLVVIEANIMGTVVLCSYTSGVVEILGDTARELCSTNEEFVSKISAILSDEKVYMEWRDVATRRILGIPRIDEYMRTIDKIYQELL
ncbi:glycosyltransferase [Lacrimispora sp.]|uniref:glycosyltransferase n=1 Tax=Lacrimispora sp. TaxID=2719234 RepID=UPI002898FCC6|nr:glycosyltransferase [Lacrimispora sp.]